MRTLAVVCLLFLAACGENDPSATSDYASSATSPGTPDGDRIAAFVEAEGKKVILGQLRDPESAKFTDVSVRWTSGRPMLCGSVNSRNGLGGMAGRQRFVTAGSDIAFLEEQVEAGEWAKVWNKFCG